MPTASATATPTPAAPWRPSPCAWPPSGPAPTPICPVAPQGPVVAGPAVIPMEGATCWVGEGWTARVDAIGSIRMERAR